MKIYKLLYCCCLVMCVQQALAQDMHFSQFFETPLLRNPSLAGVYDADVRLQIVHKDQWRSVTVPFQTTSLNFEYRTKVGDYGDFFTMGLQAFNDVAGSAVLKTSQVYPVISYHKSLHAEKAVYLSAGFIAGYSSRTYDRTKVRTSNQFDAFGFNPNLSSGEALAGNLNYFDMGAGLSFNSQYGDNADDRFLLGAAYYHFNQPASTFQQSIFSNLKPKWVYTAGIQRHINPYASVLFQADYYQQANHRELIGGFLYKHVIAKDEKDFPLYTFWAGSMYRWNDAIVPVVKFDYKNFSGGVSYDVNISKLKTASQLRGGFELSFTWLYYRHRQTNADSKFRCPKL